MLSLVKPQLYANIVLKGDARNLDFSSLNPKISL